MKSDSDIPLNDPMEWQKLIPYDTRQEAIADAITSFKGCLTKIKSKQIIKFDVSFRSKKKMQTQAFRVNKNTLDPESMSFFPSRLGKKNKTFRMKKRDLVKFKKTEPLMVIL